MTTFPTHRGSPSNCWLWLRPLQALSCQFREVLADPVSIFLWERGGGKAAEEAQGRPWLGLWSLPPAPPISTGQKLGCAALSPGVGAGLGWASCSSQLRKRQAGNAFVTARGQHKGGCRRSFLSRRKGEGQRPTSGPARSSQMLWKDVLATSSLLGGSFLHTGTGPLEDPGSQGWAHIHRHTTPLPLPSSPHIYAVQGLWDEATSYWLGCFLIF